MSAHSYREDARSESAGASGSCRRFAEEVTLLAFCPECDAEIEEEYEYEEGDIVDCPECGAELEVINTSPLEFEVISYEEEEEEGEEEWE